MRGALSIAVVAAAFITPGLAQANTDLICKGTFSDIEQPQSPAGNAVATSVDAQMKIHLTESAGTVDLPPQMALGNGLPFTRPQTHQTLKSVVFTEDKISAIVPEMLGSRMTFDIDRTTGHITVTSPGQFVGTCEKYDPATVAKLF